MTPERWRAVTEIFHAALERAPAERPSYLTEACREDSSLRAEVDALLAGHDRADVAGDPLVTGHAALSAGTVLGPYRVDALLDAGGMGEVYKARDTRLQRDVAIKVLPAHISGDADARARFEREGRAIASLSHPNICAIFDIGVHDCAPFIVSELLEGRTLRQACAAGPLTVRRALEYAVPIARGLAAAHGKGIVHRDIKPENVFITTEGRVKILDFGLAKLTTAVAVVGRARLGTDPSLTEAGLVMGTAGYMSPEQVRGLPADSRSDVFSFGTVLFEMLAGKRPFRGDTAADTSAAILHEDPPALMPDAVPRELERIMRRCLEKDAPNRFQSADDLAFALEALTATPTATATAAVDEPAPRATWLVPVVVTALGALIVVLSADWYSNPPRVDPGAYRFTPFATGIGAAHDPVWSPDGRSIAYATSVNRHSQIFVRSLDSDSAAQLTDVNNDAERPFWWPDGSRLGFVSNFRVWSVSRAGGGSELVGNAQQGLVDAATLSPDGQTLATWRRTLKPSASGSVWLSSPPNAQAREYTPAPFRVKGLFMPTYLQFSPDGRQLLLSDGTDAGDFALWLLPFPDGGRQPQRLIPNIPLVEAQLEPSQSSWMPDSLRAVITFRSASAPKGGFWMTDLRTGAASPMSGGLTPQSDPSVSPDGRKIVFTAGGPGFDLVDVPLNGAPMRDFLATGRDEYSGAWVPGTSKYVYLTNKNGEEELRIHSQTENWDRLIVAIRTFVGTKSTANLTLSGVAMSSPVASPDGQRVAYDVWGAEGVSSASSIWISPVGGGTPIKLTPAAATERAAAWSPDGRWIVCNHEDAGVVGLAIVHVGTSEPPRMLARRITGAIPAWSPDGAWIAYQTDTDVRLISPDGAHERFLTANNMSRDMGKYGWGSALVWSRDGGSLYSIRRTEDRTVQLVAIDSIKGTLRVLSTLGADFVFGVPVDPGLRFTLAPDGQSFLGTIVRTRTDLWVLENFAPKGGVLDWFRRQESP